MKKSDVLGYWKQKEGDEIKEGKLMVESVDEKGNPIKVKSVEVTKYG